MPPILAAAGDVAREYSWHHQMLPDFLWIAFVLGRRCDWRAVYSALEVVDRFVPDGPRFADGRLTTFALVPEDQRQAARAALEREAPHALPEQLGHGLGLYPSCPARWLYGDWLASHEPDPAVGIPMIRSLIADHTDKFGVQETRLRMAAFSRRVTHGKVSHPGTGVLALFPRYPHALNESEQRSVESVLRAMWLGLFGQEVAEYPDVLQWPRDFWRLNRELVTCQVPYEREEIEMPEHDGPLDPEPLMHASEMTRLLQALDRLGDQLREPQPEFVRDAESDGSIEVLLGLASRMYRMLYGFIERPSAWAPDVAGLHLRPLVDTRILIGWLVTRDDPEIFAAYREYGLGRLKLLREHIEADLGDDLDDETQQMLDYLNRRVNLERDELFQPVNLGSFAEVSVREMAIQADLKREYDLSYAPLSSANHGEWPAVRESDTRVCREPLHGSHRLGAFESPSRVLGPQPVVLALDLARGGINQVFAHLGKDVEESFGEVEEALRAAAFDGDA
jgi:Family of unknown function (DUF5677)